MPPSVENDAAAGSIPLVVELHGKTVCALYSQNYTGWKQQADANKFILAWPQGLDLQNMTEATEPDPAWNAGACCLPSFVDDIGFIRQVIERTLANDTRLDADRVYMAGHSNGCALAQMVAAQANDLVAAVGCHSFYLLASPATDYYTNPVPIIEFHGTEDETVDYTDFYGSGVGAISNIETWRDLNGCAKDPTITNSSGVSRREYSNCTNGAEVVLVTLYGVGHLPYLFPPGSPPNGVTIDTTKMAWDFVSQFGKAATTTTTTTTTTTPKATSSASMVSLSCASFAVAVLLWQ